MIVRTGPGMVSIDGAPWVRCQVRKAHECRITGREIPPHQFAYRPITNATNRWHRVLASVVDDAV